MANKISIDNIIEALSSHEGFDEPICTEHIDFIEDKKLDLYGRDTSQLAEAYHQYRMQQYKEQGLILLPKSLTAENGAKQLYASGCCLACLL
jgi:hypothetical protein